MELRCDLLEKSYFCSIANNRLPLVSSLKRVVICLKNRTFAVSQTTTVRTTLIGTGCDLLEKSYFCSIANNFWDFAESVQHVVICLKNRTFAVSQTTQTQNLIAEYELWFAWKIVLLQYRKQPSGTGITGAFRCDLLEKSYFCSIANNSVAHHFQFWAVVICLKNRTFAVSQTTWKCDYSE